MHEKETPENIVENCEIGNCEIGAVEEEKPKKWRPNERTLYDSYATRKPASKADLESKVERVMYGPRVQLHKQKLV